MKKGLVYNLIIVLLLIAIAGAGTALACFYHESQLPSPVSGSFTESTDPAHSPFNINSEYLLRYYSNERTYNGTEETAPVNERMPLKLTGDIVLTEELTITADIGIDLNGFNLDLNGNNLTIRHYRYGNVLISDSSASKTGRIINSLKNTVNCKLTDSLFNALLIIEDEIFDGATENITYERENFSAELLTQNIFDYIENYLSGFSRRIITGTTVYYLDKDITLINRFYNFDAILSWEYAQDTTESAKAALSLNGRVTPPETDTPVSLTLSISGDIVSELPEQDKTKLYFFIVVKSITERYAAAVREIKEHLHHYTYNSESFFGTPVYYMYNDLELLRSLNYYDIDYIYTAVNDTVSGIETMGEDGNGTEYILHKGESARMITLSVQITDPVTGNPYPDVTEQYSLIERININVITESNYKIANRMIAEMKQLRVFSYDNIEANLLSIEYLNAQGIKSVEYSFSEENIYAIVNNNLTVLAETLPAPSEDIYLFINFNFISGEPVQRQSRIFVIDPSVGGSIGDKDYAYYIYLNGLINEQTNGGKTADTFQMSNNYSDVAVYYGDVRYGIEIEGTPMPGITISTLDGYTKIFYIMNSVEYLIFESYMSVNGEVTHFIIYPQNQQPLDLTINVIYYFKSEGDSFYQYEKKSTFIISGIIPNTEKGIPDSNLYARIFAAYVNDDNIDYILTETAAQYKEEFTINITQTENKILSFLGLEFLTGTRKININNYDNTSDGEVLRHLADLDRLEQLTVNNCGITYQDLEYLENLRSLTVLNLSGNVIESLENLPMMPNVKEFYAAGNLLTSLDGINKFFNLQKLDISNNEIMSFRNLLDINYHLSNELPVEILMYGNLSDSDFGSLGKYNVTTQVLLVFKGIKVYREEEYEFVPDAYQIAGTKILESIMYSRFNPLPDYIYYKSDGVEYSYQLYWDSITEPNTVYIDAKAVLDEEGEPVYIYRPFFEVV